MLKEDMMMTAPGSAEVVDLPLSAGARTAAPALSQQEAISADRAAELVARLDRAELLRFGAAMFRAAHERDGVAGMEVCNRNALLLTQACLDRLLGGLNLV